MSLLLYGATGYTGHLVARTALEAGLRPILGGRSAAKLAPLAETLGCEHRTAPLDDEEALARALQGMGVLLNCAGPFERTAKPLVDACLRAGTHYMDLAGEYPAFEALVQRNDEAAAAGVMLLPGVGFGVVPTDCLAAYLKGKLPEATHLTLAFATVGGVSQGTAQTLFKDVMAEGVVRRNGRLVPARPASGSLRIDFGAGPQTAVSNPWRGDLSTAYRTTGIGDIETYTAFPPPVPQLMRAAPLLGRWWSRPGFQRLLDRLIARLPAGPDDKTLASGHSHCWGQARDGAGRSVQARLHGPEAYRFTALTAVSAAQRALAGDAPPGFQTPVGAYGADFVLSVQGVRREEVGL